MIAGCCMTPWLLLLQPILQEMGFLNSVWQACSVMYHM